MRYEDFVIQINSRGSSDDYVARVIQSPAGEGAAYFKLPFRKEEIGALLNTMAQNMGPARNATMEAFRELDPMTEEFSRLTPRQMGDALFTSLFSGDVLGLYDRSLGRVESRPGVGLRIKIKLDPKEHGLARLHSIPWEVLHRRSTQEFLGLSRLSPVVRYLEVPRPVNALDLPNPLRILAVLANPKNMAGLDLEGEKKILQKIWTGQGRVEVHVLKQARLDLMRSALLERPFHVLHYMGHGGYLDAEQKGMLFFQKQDGSAEPVTGDNLAVHLRDFQSLRLVFLNACNTARATSKAGLNPFSGVATALVMGGLPAVLAMQFPISDQAAIAFSQNFYRRIAMGDNIDTAVVEGRLAVRAREERTAEWGTPVLFTRIPDGKLFKSPGEPDTEPDTRQTGRAMTQPHGATVPTTGSRKKTMLTVNLVLLAVLVGFLWIFRERWAPPLRAWLSTIQINLEENGGSSNDSELSSSKTEPEEDIPPAKLIKKKNDVRPEDPGYPAGKTRTFSLTDDVSIEMVWVPAGEFTMGSPANESGRRGNESWHQVTLTRGFWMSRTEITQHHWKAVMGDNPSEFIGDDYPVERVSWPRVQDFLFLINRGFKGPDPFRLPTEAEWEYACRAGTEDAFAGKPEAMAWHRGNAGRTTHPVASKEPNAWGLYDMHGNVWEWCEDWKDIYNRSPRVDPRGPSSGIFKAIRGGSWDKELNNCRSANRYFVGPSSYAKEIGFRLVRAPE